MLHNDNTDRKEADLSITEEALSIIGTNAEWTGRKTTVVYKEHWHKGVVGIVASRLIESYYRPTVVLTRSGDIVAGSARSVPGFNLYEAIHACRENLLGYGGHFAAAGLTMLESNVPQFIDQFEAVVTSTIAPHLLIPEIVIDAEINFRDITHNFYNIVQQMEPFGPENMRPVFITRNVTETGFSKVVKEKHIRFVLKQGDIVLTGIGFNLADKINLLQKDQLIDIVYTIDLNEWNGVQSMQFKMIDINTPENNKQENLFSQTSNLLLSRRCVALLNALFFVEQKKKVKVCDATYTAISIAARLLLVLLTGKIDTAAKPGHHRNTVFNGCLINIKSRCVHAGSDSFAAFITPSLKNNREPAVYNIQNLQHPCAFRFLRRFLFQTTLQLWNVQGC